MSFKKTGRTTTIGTIDVEKKDKKEDKKENKNKKENKKNE